MAISSNEFNKAFREVISTEFSHISTDESSIDFIFSKKFEQKMKKLIAKQKKTYWQFVNTAMKRVAVASMAFIIIFTMTFSVKAIREPIVDFFIEVYETFTRYLFAGDTTDTITYEYKITNLPEGFTQTTTVKDDNLIMTVYENSNGDSIELSQSTTQDAQFTLDTEIGDVDTKIIAGNHVDIYTIDNLTQAMWVEDEYFFILTYVGESDLNTMQLIIESIE